MIEFFTSNTFQTVLSALNSGFLKTLQLFFITLIGALPLGLIISFGSMSRWIPFRWLGLWMQRRLPPAGESGRPPPCPCGSTICAPSPASSSFSDRWPWSPGCWYGSSVERPWCCRSSRCSMFRG